MPKGKYLTADLPGSPGAPGSSHRTAWRSTAWVLSQWRPVPPVQPASSLLGWPDRQDSVTLQVKSNRVGGHRNSVWFCSGFDYPTSNIAMLKKKSRNSTWHCEAQLQVPAGFRGGWDISVHVQQGVTSQQDAVWGVSSAGQRIWKMGE